MRIDNISTRAGDIGLVPSASLASTASFIAANNWIETTNTITATTSNPTKGSTRPIDYIRYRRVANKEYEIDMLYYQTNTGLDGSGVYLFALPGGLQFDSTIQPFDTTAGTVSNASNSRSLIDGSMGNTASNFVRVTLGAVVYDSTRFKLMTTNTMNGGTQTFNIGSTYTQLGGSNFMYSMRFTFTAA